MDNIVISFLIPVYNREDTLHRCIASIEEHFVEATNLKREIIIVDDGSTDGSLDKIHELGLFNSNIRIFSQKNHGIGYTRQRLLELAQGRYVMFVDPDDFLQGDSIPYILNVIEAEGADAAYFNKTKNVPSNVVSDNSHIEYSGLSFTENVIDFSRFIALWQFIFRKSSLKVHFNPFIKYAEDKLFLAEQIPQLKKILKFDTYVYVYCINSDSLMHNKSKAGLITRGRGYAQVAILLNEILKHNYIHFSDNLKSRCSVLINQYAYMSVYQTVAGGGR